MEWLICIHLLYTSSLCCSTGSSQVHVPESCGALLQCVLTSILRVLYIIPIAENLPFLTSQHPSSRPSTWCYHMGMIPRLNSWTHVVYVQCSPPKCPHNYAQSPFHNVYSRDSPLPKFSASTIHQLLLHGHTNKTHFFSKHDEFL